MEEEKTEEGRTDSATHARRLGTSPKIVVSGTGKVQELETGEGNDASARGGVNVWFYDGNKYKDATNDLERLDILEGLNLEDLESS